jgi:hypothetical protein
MVGKTEAPEERIYAFQQLMDTHFKWSMANEKIVLKGKYCEKVALEDGTWCDV